MLTLPNTPYALVLRTDFTDDAVWNLVHEASTTHSVEDEFEASLSFVGDPAFADLLIRKANV
jgi:hypothetical protein